MSKPRLTRLAKANETAFRTLRHMYELMERLSVDIAELHGEALRIESLLKRRKSRRRKP